MSSRDFVEPDLADEPAYVKGVFVTPSGNSRESRRALGCRGFDAVEVPGERVLGVPDVRDRPRSPDSSESLDRVPAHAEEYRVAGRRSAVDAHVAVGQHDSPGLNGVERPGHDSFEP